MKLLPVVTVAFGAALTSCVHNMPVEKERSKPIQLRTQAVGEREKTFEDRAYDTDKIKEVLKKSVFGFYNALMYRDPSTWKGKIVAVTGRFPGTAGRAREFTRSDTEFYLSAKYEMHPVQVIVTLDHGLPVTVAFGNVVPQLPPEQSIYVIGKLTGLENFMTEEGYNRAIPILQCLLIYNQNDFEFRDPLWVSSELEWIPDGTVTADSLKFEFDPGSK